MARNTVHVNFPVQWVTWGVIHSEKRLMYGDQQSREWEKHMGLDKSLSSSSLSWQMAALTINIQLWHFLKKKSAIFTAQTLYTTPAWNVLTGWWFTKVKSICSVSLTYPVSVITETNFLMLLSEGKKYLQCILCVKGVQWCTQRNNFYVLKKGPKHQHEKRNMPLQMQHWFQYVWSLQYQHIKHFSVQQTTAGS